MKLLNKELHTNILDQVDNQVRIHTVQRDRLRVWFHVRILVRNQARNTIKDKLNETT